MFESDLFAAQLYYLRKPSKATIADVFGIVFKDLTLRRVLNMRKVNNFPTDRSKKKQKYFMFIKGINFIGYEAQKFEKNVIAPFEEYDQLQAKTITNSALRKYNVPSGFISEEIESSLISDKYMSSVPLLGAFGMKKITNKGKETIDQLNLYLTEKEQILSECIDKDREKFISTLKEMNTFIFFIKNDNPDLFNSIIENVKWVNQNKPLGIENDLTEFTEAININLEYLENH